MPGKITEMAALSAPADGDLFEVVDVSDTTEAPTGTNKKFSLLDFWTYLEIAATGQAVETAAGSTYTPTWNDAGKLIRLTGTATVTLPSADLNPGQRVDFVCIGGPATFALGGGATWDVDPTPSAVARTIGSFVTAIKMGATAWALTGDLA